MKRQALVVLGSLVLVGHVRGFNPPVVLPLRSAPNVQPQTAPDRVGLPRTKPYHLPVSGPGPPGSSFLPLTQASGPVLSATQSEGGTVPLEEKGRLGNTESVLAGQAGISPSSFFIGGIVGAVLGALSVLGARIWRQSSEPVYSASPELRRALQGSLVANFDWPWDSKADETPSNPANPKASFKTTMGEFEAEIYLDRVPITASNFIDLAQSGYYNGIHFHRVIPGFMNQFGCPNTKNDPKSARAGTGGPKDGTFKNLVTGGTERRSNGGNIQDENISKDSNAPGSLSMANTGQPNSGGSQFFINVANNANLDWFSPGQSRHPVFGKITSGMDLVQQISKVPTDARDNPNTPIMMESITITGV